MRSQAFKNLVRLIGYLRHYRGWAAAAFVGALIGNVLAVTIPYVIGEVIDKGVGDGNARYMFYAGLGMVGLGLLRGLAGFLARYYSEKLSHYIAFDIRNDMYQKVLNLPFSYHDHAHVGTIVTRAIADVGEVQRFYAYGIMDLLNVGLLTLGTLAVMFYISPLLATIALIPLLPLIPLSQRFAEAVDPEWKQIMERTQTLSNHLQETAIGAQVVRVFAREDYEVGRFYGDNKTLYHNFMDLIGRWATFLPLSAFIASLSTVSLLVVGGWLESRGQGGVTAGLLVTFNAFVLQLANPLRFLGFVILLVTQAASSSERVFEILDAPQDISSKPDAQAMGQAAGQVTFENVNLTYPGERHPALKRINFTAMPGQVIGIVGATGAGKSSVVSLIPRFYDVTEGRVLIDGLDVRNIELNSLRANVGNVLQTSLLFSATIGENIAYGRVNATHEQIVAAAKAANAHGFISEFPNGYDTLVGERGVTLSGGQRQRIAIARALLINPRILILDDATSSVDTRTEHLIQQALDHLMAGRTTFIIAQRLTSVRSADQILVLDDGEIVERGTHRDLVALGGKYTDIYKLQMEDQDRLRREESFEGTLHFSAAEEARTLQEFRELAATIGAD